MIFLEHINFVNGGRGVYDSIINNLTDSEEITRYISEQSNYDVKVSKLLLGVQAALTPLPTQSATVS